MVMTIYLIKYQIRYRDMVSIPQGEWQDKEVRVVAGDDARDAVSEVIDTVAGQDFRLKEIKVCGQIDIIAQKLR